MPRTLDLALDLALRNRLPQVHIQPERDGEERPSHSRVDDPDVPYILDAGTLAESLSRPAACVVILRNGPDHGQAEHAHTDRKSTRLNSSHVEISYAVFCLKKKKK